MTKKPAVRPPRKPRGESASVTIGNLENQVRNLMIQCERAKLAEENWLSIIAKRDQILDEVQSRLEVAEVNFKTEYQFRRGDLARLEECQAKLASTEQKFEGYRMHVRDVEECR